eukprot:g2831.t1
MTRPRRRSSLDAFKDVFQGLFVPPQLRVGGSAAASRTATEMENFFDLMFVLPMQNMFMLPIDTAADVCRFAVIFLAIFNSWLGEAFYNTRFDTDDAVCRAATVLQMVCIAGMASGIVAPSAGDALHGGDRTFAASYAALRAVLVLKYVRACFYLPAVRRLTFGFMAGFASSVALWAASGAVRGGLVASLGGDVPALWVVALAFDYGTPFALLLLPAARMVPVHHSHMPERFAAFTTLILAGNLFSVMLRMPPLGGASEWSVQPLLLTCLAVVLPLAFLSLYCVGLGLAPELSSAHTWLPDGEGEGTEAATTSTMMRRKLRVYGYLYLHAPLACSVMLASTAAFRATGDTFTGGGTNAPAGAAGDRITGARVTPPMSTTNSETIGYGSLNSGQDSGQGSGRSQAAGAGCCWRQRPIAWHWMALRACAAAVLVLLPPLLRAAPQRTYMAAIAAAHVTQAMVAAFRPKALRVKAFVAGRRLSAVGTRLLADMQTPST